MSHAHHTHATPALSQRPRVSFHRSFAAAILLNSAFIVLEIFYGLWAHSLALLADAAHNLGDVLSLGVAWAGYRLAFHKPNARYTYGFGRVSIYATFFNGISLIVTSLWILYEAFLRFENPQLPNTLVVGLVATIGIAINGLSAYVLMRDQEDVNIRGAMLHMLADAGVSAGVVVAAILIALTGWLWLDSATSTVIALVILWSSWPILHEGTNLSLDAVPEQIDRTAIHEALLKDPAVAEVHDLHIWGLSTRKTALSAHIAIKPGVEHEEAVRRLHKDLKDTFRITHVTIQVERDHGRCVDEHELTD